MRIHIIGCSGSGKSYLADKLSEKYNIPHFDLDDLQWDNNAEHYGVKMPEEKRDAMLREIVSGPDWIVEGVYYKWVLDSFDTADLIYVLDMPRRLYRRRIILRFIKRKLGLAEGKKESLKSLINLLKWTKKFQNENMPKIKEILEKYPDKVVWLSSKRDVNKIIAK